MTVHDLDQFRWDAVRRRDASADGQFVYAVRSTGIFCRPSCPSRPAKRENVSFFATAELASRAGYRACKRCRPDGEQAEAHLDAIEAACRQLREEETPPDLAALAAQAGLSAGHFQRVFKQHVGLSPKQYQLAARKQRLRSALAGAETVTAAIYDAGYAASSRAYADAAAMGVAPDRLRKGAAGETIRYAMATSSLGTLLVAATDRGLCMIEFGEREPLLAELKRRFPAATLEAGDEAMTGMIAEVVRHIDEPATASRLPLDVRGTAFQERVWQALTAIPLGETISYTELAERIGRPTAARAVARACATNGVAVVVPCHRVVRGTGDLSGYKWGLDRKRTLLDRERKAAKRD